MPQLGQLALPSNLLGELCLPSMFPAHDALNLMAVKYCYQLWQPVLIRFAKSHATLRCNWNQLFWTQVACAQSMPTSLAFHILLCILYFALFHPLALSMCNQGEELWNKYLF